MTFSLSWNELFLPYQIDKQEAKKSSGELWGVSTSGGIHVILADNRDLANSILYTLVSCKGPISGQILLDEGLRPKDWIRHIGVIPSKDNLAGKLTIREHLLRAIRLRSWRGASKEVRRERVNELLILFELDGIQNRRILRFDSKDAVGLLQRRLLMFAIESSHDPWFIFATDPLAGLGEKDSLEFMRILEGYSKERNVGIVLCSRDITDEMSTYIREVSLLANGHLLYTGSMMELRSKLGEILDCPDDLAFQRLNRLLFQEARSPEELQKNSLLLTRFAHPSKPMTTPGELTGGGGNWPAPFYVTFAILTSVQLFEDFRSKKTILGIVVTNTLVYLLLSFVFFQLPLTADGLVDRAGLLFFLNVNTLFSSSLSKLVRFDRIDRRLRHERNLGILQSGSLIFSQFIASLPIRTVVYVVMGTALYYITGLRTDGFQHLIVFQSTLFLMMCASLALGILVATFMVRLEYGQFIIPFIGIMFFIYGNLSTAPDATWILKWLQYLSPVFYSFQCLMQNELSGVVNSPVNTQAFLEANMYDQMPIAACLPALAGFTLVYLLLAWLIYSIRHRPLKFNCK